MSDAKRFGRRGEEANSVTVDAFYLREIFLVTPLGLLQVNSIGKEALIVHAQLESR